MAFTFKNIKSVRNKNYKGCLWLVNTKDTIELIEGDTLPSILNIINKGKVHNMRYPKDAILSLFRNNGRCLFIVMNGDQYTQVSISDYYELSNFAKKYGLIINKKKEEVQNV